MWKTFGMSQDKRQFKNWEIHSDFPTVEKIESLWPGPSPEPALRDGVTGLLLVPASPPVSNELLLTESL